ncbi:MAG TPA: hypothetical protein DEB48_06455 [Verrucomicrobiales bacterium]|nr:hypothetical protein [Verrucomicrobiales bacterium]
MNFRRLPFLALFTSLLLIIPKAFALELTRAMYRGQDFQSSIFGGKSDGYTFPKSQSFDPQKAPNFTLGYAEFAVHDFQLTPAMIYTINFGLANLVRSHQTVFQRNVSRDFRVRFRIFGKYEDYAEYTKKRYNGKKVSPNLLGFFSPNTREIVTWKQKPSMTWRLVPTLLHEGCHAIMDNMFGALPFWMIEGSADWLGEAPAWLQKADGLRNDQHLRWVRLNRMRDEGKLPNLKKYLLSNSYDQWDSMFDGNIGLGYDIGWSIFDFFMKTHPQATKFLGDIVNDRDVLAARRQGQGRLENAFEKAINRNWGGKGSGGTALLEKGWHSWIKIKAKNAQNELLKAGRSPK